MQGKLTYVNKQAFNVLGYPAGYDISNLNTINLYIPEDRPRAIENIKLCLMGKRDNSNEYTMIRFDGTLINVLVYSTPIFKESQHVGLRGIIIDITDRKLANEQIKQKNDELQKLNATKDKFFSIIAHDLKSPFNAILGFSDLLINQIKEKDYEGIDEYAKIIEQSSQRAMDLLMNLLEWSRAQTGRLEFNPENFELVDLIVENKVLFDFIAGQKSITIQNVLPHNLVVFADKAMISTVLRNLISNAIKFTRQGGKITISIEKKENEILVSVSDNGVGISVARVEKLFRIDESDSTKGTNNESGTGLGLILCKEFVEKHHGTIWVESTVGSGSTFSFTLPY
jgi:PAS domain S-box-containing protein